MTTLTTRIERAPADPRGVPRATRDTVLLLTLYAVLRMVLPSQYVVGPLGGAGQPAQLLGLGIALLWTADWLGRPWPRSGVRQPLKLYALAFLLAVLASYLIAALRPLNSQEQLAADRSILNVIAWLGIMLAALDGISTRSRLDTLLRRIVLLGGLLGALGVIQLLTRQSYLQYLGLPGLANTGVDPLLLARGSFLRPQGTSISPIEYGAFLTMVLPLALHYAVADAKRRPFLSRWLPAVFIACALALSLSRSAIIGTVVGMAVFLPAWPARLRRRVYAAAAAFLLAASVSLHGFFGTILSLFGGIGTDASTESRLNSYGVAWSFITRNPLFGRGTGTFLPEYWILDNQFLGSLIEIGVVGLLCVLLLFLSGIRTSWRVRELASEPGGQAPVSRLGPVIAASIAAGAVSFAFFDAFSFPQVPSMLFLMLGCAGALRRLSLEGDGAGLPLSYRQPLGSYGGGLTLWNLSGTVRRAWPVAVAGVVATIAGTLIAVTTPGVYTEQDSIIFVAPRGTGLADGGTSLVSMAGTVESQLGEQGPLALSQTATIANTGVRDGVWVRLPNDGDQWGTNFDQEDLDVEVVGGSAGQVSAEMRATVSRVQSLLEKDQLSAGARPDQLIETGLSPASPPVTYLRGSASRAGATAIVLGLALTLVVTVMTDRWRARRRERQSRGRRSSWSA